MKKVLIDRVVREEFHIEDNAEVLVDQI